MPECRADLSDAAFPTPDRATTPAVTHPFVPTPVEDDVRPDKADGDKKGVISRRRPRRVRR